MRRFRRPFRPVGRRLLRGLRRAAPRRAARAQLQQAHRLLANGAYSEAAAEFLAVARLAEEGGFRQASRLYISAGAAAVQAGEVEQGVHLLLTGLDHLQQSAAPAQLARVATRIVSELRSAGHAAAADQVESYLEANRIELPAERGAPMTAGILPPKCPQCGGTVHPDEIDWVDARSAVCDYCGSLLPARA